MISSKALEDTAVENKTPVEDVTNLSTHQHPAVFLAPTAEELGRLSLVTNSPSSVQTSDAALSFASLLNRGSSQE